jgi:hypothetical protein
MCRNHSSQSLFKEKKSHRLHGSILMGNHFSHLIEMAGLRQIKKADGKVHGVSAKQPT